MSRKLITLEVLEDQAKVFDKMQELLGHESPEETFSMLVRLAEAALSLTSLDNPDVRMYTRAGNVSGRDVTCPECSKKFVPVFQNDGYQEIAVRLA